MVGGELRAEGVGSGPLGWVAGGVIHYGSATPIMPADKDARLD